MKNKVLRLAIVAVLVVAMVLSMAACNDPKPVVTETPTPSVTPAPTKTPDKTPAPTATPVVPSAADDSALAKATYGIELKAQDFTYGVIANKDDPTERYSDVIVEFNEDLMQNYKALTGTDSASKPCVKWDVSYEGEGKFDKTTAYTAEVYTDLAGKTRARLVFSKVAPAGVYTVTATVTAEDNGFLFGRFGKIKEEKVVYELTTIVNVNKADLKIKTPSYVAPVEELAATVVSKAPIAPAFSIKLTADTTADDVTATKNAKATETKTLNKNITAEEALYDNLFKAFGDYDYYLRAGSMIDTTKVGSYEILVSAHKKGAAAKEETIIPFAELPSINYNVTFENGKQYFVDAYDWNAIRDAATSILDIKAVAGVDQLNKVKLARARYDALTDAQKAFFTTGIVATDFTALVAADYLGQKTIGGFLCAATQTSDAVELLVPTDFFNVVAPKDWTLVAGTQTIDRANSAKTIYGILTTAETAAKQEAVVNAWNKAVKDAKFLTYAVLTDADANTTDKVIDIVLTFNINNASAVAAYNTVKTYYDALSDAEKDIINATFTWADDITNGGKANDEKYQYGEKITSNNGYTAFKMVTRLFDVKAAEEVKTLIAAAAAAYNRAVLNANGKFIYEDEFGFAASADADDLDNEAGTGKDATAATENQYGGVVYYLSNAEVVAVTNQAYAAFEKLTKPQKALLNGRVVEDADASATTGIHKNFDNDSWTYKTVLASLKTMNEVVGYMQQVINHTKIEDLAHIAAKTPAYNSLNSIVYGKVGEVKVNYVTVDGRTTFNAVGDILRAYATDSASLDAVVAEYKAMVDYILAAEAYKAEQIAALNAMIATEFVAENHTDAEIAVATATTNPVLAGIVNGIKLEKDPVYSTKLVAAVINDIAPVIVKAGVTVQSILNKNFETYEEAKAAFEGLYNLDKALSVFVKNFSNTVVTSLSSGDTTVTEMLFKDLTTPD